MMLGIFAVFQNAPATSNSIMQNPNKAKNHFQSVDNGNKIATKMHMTPINPIAIMTPKLSPLSLAMCYLPMTNISTPKRSLLHAYRIKKAMPTVTTFEATNQVIPFLPVKSSVSTFRASKLNRSIQPWHLPPPEKTTSIVASPRVVSIAIHIVQVIHRMLESGTTKWRCIMAAVQHSDMENEIKVVCDNIVALRGCPLLVLYYPGMDGAMLIDDVPYCYRAFRDQGITKETPIPTCDVIIHTFGGDPIAAYKLGQIIRDFTNDVTFLVSEYAYSAGTLLCLAGNRIRLGHYAGLSPLDISKEEVELASIDNFIQFAKACQKEIQDTISDDQQEICSVASDLLCQLVQQVSALKVGEYYRARTLAGHYAEELLDHYMLLDLPNAKGRRNKIIGKLLFGAPAHEFHMDFHLCASLGLVLEEMITTESDATKHLISLLDDFAFRGLICQNITDELKMPFIALYT